jgi:solute carrier family 15 (peptide/histidine transporter), member 3/4
VCHRSAAMGEVAADMYTQDGTVDMKGNPAVKKGTGDWRACPYILGKLLLLV